MATRMTKHQGNLAIQRELWVLDRPEARALQRLLKARGLGRRGHYWYMTATRPINRATRRAEWPVTISTAGFGSAEMSRLLADAGISVTWLEMDK